MSMTAVTPPRWSLGRSLLLLSLVGLAALRRQGRRRSHAARQGRQAIFVNADGTPKSSTTGRPSSAFRPPAPGRSKGSMGELMKSASRSPRTTSSATGRTTTRPGRRTRSPARNNTDTPILTYNIASHFDVKREYNAGTGEQTNVISENTTDRPWDQRQYMRVEWATNLAEPDRRPDQSDGLAVDQEARGRLHGRRGGARAHPPGPSDHHAGLHRLRHEGDADARLSRCA